MKQNKTQNSLAKVYDLYGPMLYGIALEICEVEKTAEEIIFTTFQKFVKQNYLNSKKELFCALLIKLMIQTAHEQLNKNSAVFNFKVKQFEKAPLLHKLLCELIPLEDHCNNVKITRLEAARQIRSEFNLIFRQEVIF